MPTIAQLVEKEELRLLRRVNRLLWIHVLNDVAYAHVYIRLRRKSRTRPCEKSHGFD